MATTGFGQAANLHLQVEHVEVRRAALVDVAFGTTHRLVTAGTEGIGAFTGEDDDTDFLVVVGAVEGVDQLLHRFRAEGVALLRPGDGDLGDAFGKFVADVAVFDGRLARLPFKGGSDHGRMSVGFGWLEMAASIPRRLLPYNECISGKGEGVCNAARLPGSAWLPSF
jgi:hypothetical protein